MNFLIVESHAKCKTLERILGTKNWRVLATGGHVERLAEDRKVHPPKEVKKAYWAHRPGELPAPPWYWTENGEAAVKAIIEKVGRCGDSTLYIATDPDREGERIAWHLYKLLAPLRRACHRVSFQEITRTAVLSAIKNPRDLDKALVDAALIRVFLDRLIGWRSRSIVRKYVAHGNCSMGRVQTPTLGFVVERELEREAFKPTKYYEVRAKTIFADWRVRFHSKHDKDAWIDKYGRYDPHRTSKLEVAQYAHAMLDQYRIITIVAVNQRIKTQPPPAPFSTDTMLQAASSRLGWSPVKTNTLASKLYHAGHITYIRTDSTRMAQDAVLAGRELISTTWGSDYLGSIPNVQQGAGAQDAHEAIRPTDFAADHVPMEDPDAIKLYKLIRAQAIASLMVPAERVTLLLTAECRGLDRPLEAKVGWYSAAGWRKAFEGIGEPLRVDPIVVEMGSVCELLSSDDNQPNPLLVEDETQPPSRYKAHSLIKAMKEAGIGRPSTYASTIKTLEDRKYILVDKGSLVPTDAGRTVWLQVAPLFLLPDGSAVFKTDYTAQMEKRLDDVAGGKLTASETWDLMLEDFKKAHENAQETTKSGPLLSRTKERLEDYLKAYPELECEIGDINELTEEEGREILKELDNRSDLSPPPTRRQVKFLAELLRKLDLTLEEAIKAAGVCLAGDTPNLNDMNKIIDFLITELQAQTDKPASPKQIKFIIDLTKKLDIDEAEACKMVGVNSFSELTGGKEGSASRLITILKKMLEDREG